MAAMVFLADDSKMVRAAVTYTLEKQGFKVVTAPDGKMALERLRALRDEGHLPKLIITDFNMPQANGLKFLQGLKVEPQLKFVPVLFLTTEVDPKLKEQAKAGGAAGWLTKPFSPEQLLAVVAKFVK